MDAVERAQVHVALAQTINSLLGLYLKVRGVSPEDHGMEKERVRHWETGAGKLTLGNRH